MSRINFVVNFSPRKVTSWGSPIGNFSRTSVFSRKFAFSGVSTKSRGKPADALQLVNNNVIIVFKFVFSHFGSGGTIM